MKTHRELHDEWMKDPVFRAEYDALALEFELASALIEKRLKRKMTQTALAKKIGTKQSAIARLESGAANPTIKFLKKVASALDTRLVISL